MMFPNMFIDHFRFSRRQNAVPEAIFTNQKGYGNIPGSEHLGQFNADKPTTNDDSSFTYVVIRGVLLQ